MHRFISLLAAIVAMGAFATPAQAAPDGVAAAGTVASSQQIQVVGRGARLIPADEFAAMRGEYRMADGRLLSVGGVRHRPTAELGQGAALALVAVGPNQYASTDGTMVLQFGAHANGNIDGVTITLQNGTH